MNESFVRKSSPLISIDVVVYSFNAIYWAAFRLTSWIMIQLTRGSLTARPKGSLYFQHSVIFRCNDACLHCTDRPDV